MPTQGLSGSHGSAELATPFAHPSRSVLGTLMAVGGAEDKLRRRVVLRQFVESAGAHMHRNPTRAGEQRETAGPRIVVVPTASSLAPEVVQVYEAAFAACGAGEVLTARPETRADADDPALSDLVDRADGVFMTGGNQLKLSAAISGTAFADALARLYHSGGIVGGTSAGASILSTHMIAFGTGGATPKQRMSQLAAGLGLIGGVIIDQHFEQRNRYGRLTSLVAQSPALLGIGVDEDTAAIITGGRYLEVAGRGSVTVLDMANATSNAHEARRTAPLLISGAQLHVLPATSRFDLHERTLVGFGTPDTARDVAETKVAEAQLLHLARRISSEGADSSAPERNRQRAVRRALTRLAVNDPQIPAAPVEGSLT